MKKGDLFLILLAAALLLAMVFTVIFKGERSRHGYGEFRPNNITGSPVAGLLSVRVRG